MPHGAVGVQAWLLHSLCGNSCHPAPPPRLDTNSLPPCRQKPRPRIPASPRLTPQCALNPGQGEDGAPPHRLQGQQGEHTCALGPHHTVSLEGIQSPTPVLAKLLQTECPNCDPKPTYVSENANTALTPERARWGSLGHMCQGFTASACCPGDRSGTGTGSGEPAASREEGNSKPWRSTPPHRCGAAHCT